MDKYIKPYGKAIVAGLVAGLVAWLKSKSGGVTADEWVEILITALVGGGATWAIPNKPYTPPAA